LPAIAASLRRGGSARQSGSESGAVMGSQAPDSAEKLRSVRGKKGDILILSLPFAREACSAASRALEGNGDFMIFCCCDSRKSLVYGSE